MKKPDVPTLREWLQEEPFGLALSSGFFGFFSHAGVLTALVEEGFEPTFGSGSSSGALVVSGFAAGLGPDEFKHEMQKLTRADFWDPYPGFGFLRGQKFREILERMLPVSDFADLRFPVTLSVFDVVKMKTRVLDEGLLAPAIHASCAVPGMFHPVTHAGSILVDGGVLDRPGVEGIKPGARTLYHHLPTTARWRWGKSVPIVENRVALVLNGVPKVGPNQLDEGKRAYASALKATRRALGTPVTGGKLDIELGDAELRD
jgi:NTE family protein